MKTYNEYRNYDHIKGIPNTLIVEGLIYSFTYDKLKQKIENLFKKYHILYDISINNGVIVNFTNIKTKEFFDDLHSLLNISGYYISKYKGDDNKFIKGNLTIKDYFNNNKLSIIINKNFDFEDKGIKTVLYHVSDQKHKDKILKSGLTIKSKNTLENQPERIYFFDTLEYIDNFIEEKIDLDYTFKPLILKINVKKLNQLRLYTDPKYPGVDAFYTYDFIPSYAIEEMKY